MNTSIAIKETRVSVSTNFIEICKILCATGLLALSAQIAFPLPFTPVPVTLQTVVIFLLAAVLGPKKAALTVLAYITEGLLGLPVFSKAGSGILWLCGPTGGYLIGFIIAAFSAGYFMQKGTHKSFMRTALVMILSSMIILFMGSLWLTHFMSFKSAFSVGFLPFLGAEIIKVFMATSLFPLFRK